jgi:hypothetical protein
MYNHLIQPLQFFNFFLLMRLGNRLNYKGTG